MIYLLVFLYLFSLSYFYDFKGYSKKFKFHYYLSLLLLLMIAGFRYRMAPDSIVYMNDYMYRTDSIFNITFESFNSRYQPLWVLLNSLCKTISRDFVIMQFATAFILNYTLYYFFKTTTNKFFTCILFYFISSYLYFNMEIMRESLAVAMFLISILMFNKNKYLKSGVFFLLATQFHSFAVILGVVYFFILDFIPQWIKYLVASLMVVFLIAIPNPLLLIGGLFGSTAVLNYSEAVLGSISISGYIYMLIRILIVLYAILKFRKSKEFPFLKLDKNILINIGVIYIMLVIIRTFSIPFLERILNYFSIIVILIGTSMFFYYIKRKAVNKMKFNTYVLVIGLSVFFNIYPMLKFIPDWNAPFYRRYFPYNSIFEKEYNLERENINTVESKEY